MEAAAKSIDVEVDVVVGDDATFDQLFSELVANGFVNRVCMKSLDYVDWVLTEDYKKTLSEDELQAVITEDEIRRIVIGKGVGVAPIIFAKNRFGFMTKIEDGKVEPASDNDLLECWKGDKMKADAQVEKMEIEVKESNFVKTCIAATTIVALAVGALIFYDRFR